jgi:hypothetical protein
MISLVLQTVSTKECQILFLEGSLLRMFLPRLHVGDFLAQRAKWYSAGCKPGGLATTIYIKCRMRDIAPGIVAPKKLASGKFSKGE